MHEADPRQSINPSEGVRERIGELDRQRDLRYVQELLGGNADALALLETLSLVGSPDLEEDIDSIVALVPRGPEGDFEKIAEQISGNELLRNTFADIVATLFHKSKRISTDASRAQDVEDVLGNCPTPRSLQTTIEAERDAIAEFAPKDSVFLGKVEAALANLEALQIVLYRNRFHADLILHAQGFKTEDTQ